MKAIKEFIKRNIIFEARRNVSISNIFYGEEECYIKEGFGGQPIKSSPLYQFFYKYIQGDKKDAFENFYDWYSDQFEKYWNIDNKKGGMRQGSLYSLIEEKHLQKNKKFNSQKDFDASIVAEGIKQRVVERFALVDSIIKNGYVFDPYDPIIAIKKGNKYILRAGHHRCCAIAALGWDYCPQVLTPKNVTAKYLYSWFQEIK